MKWKSGASTDLINIQERESTGCSCVKRHCKQIILKRISCCRNSSFKWMRRMERNGELPIFFFLKKRKVSDLFATCSRSQTEKNLLKLFNNRKLNLNENSFLIVIDKVCLTLFTHEHWKLVVKQTVFHFISDLMCQLWNAMRSFAFNLFDNHALPSKF